MNGYAECRKAQIQFLGFIYSFRMECLLNAEIGTHVVIIGCLRFAPANQMRE